MPLTRNREAEAGGDEEGSSTTDHMSMWDA